MKILFVVGDAFLSEPFGVMQLSAILKKRGHKTRLCIIKKHVLEPVLSGFEPDVVAYSCMSPEVPLFKKADSGVLSWASKRGRKVYRIMGGSHPTYFPEIREEMGLDAICVGEGDRAFLRFLESIERGVSFGVIPNIIVAGGSVADMEKELIHDLDELPYVDRDIFADAYPLYKYIAMKGFMVGRGCPYECTYCHNHAFKSLFKGAGKIVRRRSVDNVIEEMKYVVTKYAPVQLIKISDDTFAHKIDDWLLRFLEKYQKEIRLPFYCLMRSNTLTEKMAKLLRKAGCVSIGMSVECGNERVRNDILKRGLNDDIVRRSFRYARENGIRTYGNTLLAIPGTTFANDYESFLFTRSLKMTVPTFGVFNPYPRTKLTEYAMELGQLAPTFDFQNFFGKPSPLSNFSPKEKEMQLKIAYLGPLFCDLPDTFLPLFKAILSSRFLRPYKIFGAFYFIIKVGIFIFPRIYPLTHPTRILFLFWEAVKFFIPRKNIIVS